jgi:hypothetical protein
MESSLKKIKNQSTDNSVSIDPIPKYLLDIIYQKHKISNDNTILYYCQEPKGSNSLVICEHFISIVVYDSLRKLEWQNINSINYNDRGHVFDFESTTYNNYIVPASLFGIKNCSNSFQVGNIIAEQLNSIVTSYESPIKKKFNEILIEIETVIETTDEIKREEPEFGNRIIKIYDDCVKKYGKNELPLRLKVYLVMGLMAIKEFQNALEEIDYVINNSAETSDLSFLYQIKADILTDLNDDYEALICLKKAYKLSLDNIEKIECRDSINLVMAHFNENFVDLPYSKRKLVLIDNDLKSTPIDTFLVLDKNSLPKKLKFPNNNPKIRELYVVHPHIKDIYMPYSDYEVNLFRDKFEEFSYFIQCLGAKAMTIKVDKRDQNSRSNLINLSSYQDKKKTIDGSIGFKGLGINGSNKDDKIYESSKNTNKDEINENETSYSRTQIFNPTKKPYLPSDMIWFENESSWQRLYKQRTTGNIMRHHDVLSSKSSYSISQNEEITLKEAFIDYIGGGFSFKMVNANGGLSTEQNKKITELVDSTFTQSDTIQWDIEIEFESLENIEINRLESLKLNNGSFVRNDIDAEPQSNTENNTIKGSNVTNDFEQEYIEEVKYMLEDDGIIDAKEQSILERFRTRKGISENKAIELEKKIIPIGDLNENEKEYLDEYKELLNDGEIKEKERKMLNRMANRLVISEERVNQLEEYIK